MKSKLLLPKLATYLIGAGVILMMLGYALSGFSTDRFQMKKIFYVYKRTTSLNRTVLN